MTNTLTENVAIETEQPEETWVPKAETYGEYVARCAKSKVSPLSLHKWNKFVLHCGISLRV